MEKAYTNVMDNPRLSRLVEAAKELCPGAKLYTNMCALYDDDDLNILLVIDNTTDDICEKVGQAVDPNYSTARLDDYYPIYVVPADGPVGDLIPIE